MSNIYDSVQNSENNEIEINVLQTNSSVKRKADDVKTSNKKQSKLNFIKRIEDPQNNWQSEDSSPKVGRPRSSPIWKFFNGDENSKLVICSVSECNAKISNHTSNLKNHLKRKRTEEYKHFEKLQNECVNEKKQNSDNQPKITDLIESKSKYNLNDKKLILSEKKLAYFLASSRYPYNMLNCRQFHHFIEHLDPRFGIPGQSKLSQHANEISAQLKSKIISLLSSSPKFALTCDLWTCKNLTNSYLGITAHNFNAMNKTANNLLLGLQLINESHTGKNVKICLEKVLENYGFSLKNVSRIVTDNGSNMLKTFKLLAIDSQTKEYINSIDETIEVINENMFEYEKYETIDNENSESIQCDINETLNV